jgi:hypothetical protein
MALFHRTSCDRSSSNNPPGGLFFGNSFTVGHGWQVELASAFLIKGCNRTVFGDFSKTSLPSVSSGIVIDHLARNGKLYRPPGRISNAPPSGEKGPPPWRPRSTSACNDANIVPKPSLCSRGLSPRRSLQQATRPASGPPMPNGTLAGAIGGPAGRPPNGGPKRISIGCGPYFGFWDPT